MSILIKGISLPSAEEEARLIVLHHDGYAEGMDFSKHEIIPVPPHGDLIDRQVVKNYWVITEDGTRAVEVADIDAAPTIIPAEGET